MKALCGLLECETCPLREKCGGCAETGGKPFGGTCPIAECCKSGGCENHGQAFAAPCRLKEQLIAEFNALDIPDMEEVKNDFYNAPNDLSQVLSELNQVIGDEETEEQLQKLMEYLKTTPEKK